MLVYREFALTAGGVGLAVGTGKSAFAYLSNSEYVVAELNQGEHEIFVQARSAEPSKVRVVLKAGDRVCLRTSASLGTLAKVVIPIALIATGYHFHLDEVPCLPTSELAKYKEVAITYGAN